MLSDPVRFSHLKHIAKSAAHYHHAATVGRDDKPWLRGGRSLHAVLFETPYVVFDGAQRRGKAWDTFLEVELGGVLSTHPGETPEVILTKDLPVYQEMAQSIRRELHRQGLSHLLEGDVEKRIEWEWLGRKCAGTPDVAHPGWIVDVKTTCNADPRRFHWDARKYSYAEQIQWYHGGYHPTLGDVPNCDLFIIAVEKTAPYPVVVWRLTDKMREQAERTLRLWFEQLLACEASNQWPGYCQTVQELDVLESEETLTLQIEGEDVDVE